MSVFGRLTSVGTKFLRSSITPAIGSDAVGSSLPKPGGLVQIAVRYIIRDHFPRPSEYKRIIKHGYKKRMSCPGGQRIMMRKILKGKHVYCH